MKKELIVDLIEKLINDEPYDLELLDNVYTETLVEEFLLNTAYRLVNTYTKVQRRKMWNSRLFSCYSWIYVNLSKFT